MRKIYSPPFNKFANFVLYGLLSIVVITLAQNPKDISGCESSQLIPPQKKQVTIGYVKDIPNQDELEKFPWKFYDYINVIAYPPKAKSVWNEIFFPENPKNLEPMRVLAANKPPTAKILLSIRNYDLTQWPNDNVTYSLIVDQTAKTIEDYNLDGVDIEYPGMRGSICHEDDSGALIWNKGGRDPGFVTFIGDLRDRLDTKTLMLTVGKEPIIDPNGVLNAKINFLNIETYHYSLYENIVDRSKAPAVVSYPNAPLDVFTATIRDTWISKIDKEKIIMGVDFGNTFQVIPNGKIKTTQTVEFNPIQIDDKPGDIGKYIDLINNICPGDDDTQVYNTLDLYSFPWKDLSTSVLDHCKAKPKWVDNFEEVSSTSWLFRDDPDTGLFHYISYENTKSLSYKLNYLITESMGGMSISDVSYDDDKGSLLSFIQVIRDIKPNESGTPDPNGTGGAGGAGNSPSPSPTNPNNTTNPISESVNNNKGGVIAGAVIGSLFGSIIILGAGFLWYRNRDRPKSSSFKSLLNFKAIPSSIRNHTNSRDTEMTSDPSPNHRFAVPSTTAVIPIASGYVTALFDFTGKEENDLSFKKGDKIEVLERGDGPNDWWVGRVNGAVGEFPGNYVKET